MRRWQSRLHLALAGLWALALVPTLLWWSDSVLWVAIVSLYANAVGHISSYQAAHAEEKLLGEVRRCRDRPNESSPT